MLLRNKLGPVNWQFMPTKQFDPEDFAGFLKLLPKSVEGKGDPSRGRGAPRQLPYSGFHSARPRPRRCDRGRGRFQSFP